MPYIPTEKRGQYQTLIDSLLALLREGDEGDLNYVLTKIVTGSIGRRYRDVAKGVGALECAKLELYRRLGASVENRAIARNSDIPEYYFFEQDN